MPIESLPPRTVRQIGSSQCLTDASSVVKELIDNALDARATSVSVEITANTLDAIQVRDNGHGVAPEDRPALCRPHCTSKIRDFADLHAVGGRWLGFRGEALACLAELSGTLCILTRAEGEAVAVVLRVDRSGEVCGEELASHPVGTTVKALDLFAAVPVRKQTALKNSSKCLARIKRSLQAYALARPGVRFSMKVLKAKTEKGDWLYAPKVGFTVEDAASKVVGRECASQCEWSVFESNGYEVQAFLPKSEATSAKINNIGQFLSVDFRPVSTQRGVLKQVVMLFKERLRKSNASLKDIKDPFLYLNIVCPANSYDPNVEPAKDDVLFDDSSSVISVAEQLFANFYPAIHVVERLQATQTSRTAPRSSSSTPNESIDIFEDPHQSFCQTPPERIEGENTARALRDITISNPWAIAKLTSSASGLRSARVSEGQLLTPRWGRDDMLSSSPPSRPEHLRLSADNMLPSPQASSPSHRLRSDGPQSSPQTPERVAPSPRCSGEQLRPIGGLPFSTAGHTLVRSGVETAPQSSSSDHLSASAEVLDMSSQLQQHLTPPTGAVRPRRKSNVLNPFVPPFRDLEQHRVPQPPSQERRVQRKRGRGLDAFERMSDEVSMRQSLLPTAEHFVQGSGPTRNRDIREYIGGNGPFKRSRREALAPSNSPAEDSLPSSSLTNDLPKRRGQDSRSINHTGKNGSGYDYDTNDDSDENFDATFQRYTQPSHSQDTKRQAGQDCATASTERSLLDPYRLEPGDTEGTVKRRPRSLRHATAKSNRLPLEGIPPNANLRGVTLSLTTTVQTVNAHAKRLNVSAGVSRWTIAPETFYTNAFAAVPPEVVRAWTHRLHVLLSHRSVDGVVPEITDHTLKIAIERQAETMDV